MMEKPIPKVEKILANPRWFQQKSIHFLTFVWPRSKPFHRYNEISGSDSFTRWLVGVKGVKGAKGARGVRGAKFMRDVKGAGGAKADVKGRKGVGLRGAKGARNVKADEKGAKTVEKLKRVGGGQGVWKVLRVSKVWRVQMVQGVWRV